MLPLSISVSNLELYRMWRESEDLELDWLLRRLRGEEPQTENMLAGIAMHSALEAAEIGESMCLVFDGYKFYFKCDGNLELPTCRELPMEKQYGNLTVRGRVDGLHGRSVTDYKSTQSFDADRLLEGFQWRFYLDMLECDRFNWKVFVLAERFFHEYDIIQIHDLSQYRYAGLADDCARLAEDFAQFAGQLDQSGISWAKTVVPENRLERQLRDSIARVPRAEIPQ